MHIYLLPLFVATSMDAANVASWTDGIYIGYVYINRYIDIYVLFICMYLLPLFVATSMDAANVASCTDGIYIGYI